MAIDLSEPIAAIASPPGPAKRGIIRVSGSDVVPVVTACFEPKDGSPRMQDIRLPTRTVGHLRAAGISVPVPVSVMLWPNNRSYTGQPMAEIHMVGSPPLLDAVLETIFENGARGANRGEFTMRSFLAGKIDLVQAEAVLGVIDATDHEELEAALTQLGGGITSQLAFVRSEILSLLGDLEAGLDFVEEDIEFISSKQIFDRLSAAALLIDQLSDSSTSRLPSGYTPRVVLAGLPNAGKSTLYNKLAGEGKAIVSSTAGTTRDYLVGVVDLDGLAVQLIDTAGWESTTDLIMAQAQDLRSNQLGSSDVVLWCKAANLSDADELADARLRQQAEEHNTGIIDVVTQSDLLPPNTTVQTSICVSAKTGSGIEQLCTHVKRHFIESRSSRSQLLSTTTARCTESLSKTHLAITAAIDAVQCQAGDEVVAFELRDALQQIGIILGEVYTDDILDHIFSNFCIGK